MTDGLTEALRQQFPHGIMLRASVALVEGENAELVVLGERGFQVGGADAALRDWAGGLVAGIRWNRFEPTGLRMALLSEFAARDMLAPLPASEETDQYTKQRLWFAQVAEEPDAAAERIAGHRAVILGCGGLGSLVAVHLAAMGVGKLLLIDHDAVEITNFNRQFTYRRSDLGRPKVNALADFLADRYPDTEIDTVSATVGEGTLETVAAPLVENSGPGGWTLFCCADRPVGTLSAVVAAFARTHGGAAVFAAAGLEEAAVGPVLNAADDVGHRLFTQEMDELGAVARATLGDPIMSASIAPVNTMAATGMVSEWLNGVVLRRQTRARSSRYVMNLKDTQVHEERTWS
ncbi:ThiF family adenylyltransferase [Streptomyces bambusae]|uniref:HesA/MoeB/ThiF family protein n=1 Tax=Streptomyces bambusae TaxID=1550616 RepID=UPI001CFF98A2|nr:ThiF family adenylyltransferase [Streptomyces bambusae]MCB5169895.1 ThiF family adenylyltransferase [Streptomyces bambusae]